MGISTGLGESVATGSDAYDKPEEGIGGDLKAVLLVTCCKGTNMTTDSKEQHAVGNR